jgi:tetratricopeptide (TPR) repeat protein
MRNFAFSVLLFLAMEGCVPKGEGLDFTGIGRGLSPLDSLGALFSYLSHRSGPAADTFRVLVAAELAYELVRLYPDSAYKIIQNHLPIVEKYQFNRGLHALHNSQAFLLVLQGHLDSARAILTDLEKNTYPYEISNTYNIIGIIHAYRSEYPEAMEYFKRAIEIREKIGDKRGLATSYNNLASTYFYRGEYNEALRFYEKSEQMRLSIRDEKGLGDCYNNIANIYYIQAQYPKALEYYQKSLRIREKLADRQALAALYNNISYLHNQQGDHSRAILYLKKAISIQEKINDKRGLCRSYDNLAQFYMETNMQDSSFFYFERAMRIQSEMGDKHTMATTYNNIANLYRNIHRYSEAIGYYKRAIQLQRQIHDLVGLAMSCKNVGSLYFELSQPQIAYDYLLQSVQIAREARALRVLKDALRHLSNVESQLAEGTLNFSLHKRALEHFRESAALKDSIYDEERIRAYERLKSQYEYEKRESALRAEQEKERLLAQAEIRQRETQRNFSLLALVLSIMGLGVLGYAFRVIYRQRASLKQTNKSLEETNGVLQVTIEALEDSNRVIQAQKEALAEKNEAVLSSITYARRIQEVILPSKERWQSLLPNSFLLYMPKDIVAGDFYWLEETSEHIYVGVADATGHGVPGAFLSLICISSLNKALLEEGLTQPKDILDRVKAIVSTHLAQHEAKLRDGMDIALLQLSKLNPLRITFAGANRPLWLFTAQDGFIEFTPIKQPIGYTEITRPYEEHSMTLPSDSSTMIYLFTDGLIDQMGGPQTKKLMAKRLREFLSTIIHFPLPEQRAALQGFLLQWKGEYPQTDDITCIGLRVEKQTVELLRPQ